MTDFLDTEPLETAFPPDQGSTSRPEPVDDRRREAPHDHLLTVLGLDRANTVSDLLAVLRDALNTEAPGAKNSLLRVGIDVASALGRLDEGTQALLTRPGLDLGAAQERGDRSNQRPARPDGTTGPGAASGPNSPDPHNKALECALDREAFLQAQCDMLALRLDRTNSALRSARADVEKARSEHDSQVAHLRRELGQARDKAVAEASGLQRDLQASLEASQDDGKRWRRLLGSAASHLGDKLKRAELPVRHDLLQHLHSSAQDQAYLNVRRLEATVAPKLQRLWRRAGALDAHMRLVADSRLFHPEYYRNQFASTLPPETDLLHHYVTRGWMAGANPNPLFSVQFYLMRNPALIAEGVEPLRHYIEQGSAAGRDPHPAFVTRHYESLCGGEPEPGSTWLRRFLRLDLPSCSPHPLFDPVDYAQRAGLRENHAAVALLHYLLSGWQAGLRFGALFDPAYYQAQLGEEAVTGEPYGHYVLLGAPNRLNPHPLFDAVHYLKARPGVVPAELDPLVDYLLVGESEGASPNPFFDPAHYRKRHMGATTSLSALEHYLAEGARESHDPHPDFNAKAYDRARRDRQSDRRSALEHFLHSGFRDLDWAEIPAPAGDEAKRPAVPVETPVATPQVASVPVRHYPGKAKLKEGRPTVLLVAHAAGEHLFGSERSFLDMLDGLANIPVNVCVTVPRNVPNYTNAIRLLARDVYVFDYRWWRKGEDSSPQVRATFRGIIDDRKIDAVHVNTIMLREALEAAREAGIPGVVQVRELIGQDAALQDLIGRTPEAIVTETKRRSDWIIGNSATTAAAFRKENRTFAIPNPIDLADMDLPPRAADGTIRFGLISSNIPKKGLLDAVKLARLAADSALNARFVIIGPETDLVRDLKHQQQSGDVPPNVEFPGYAATPKDAIAQLDVVLSFSHFAESFGRTVLEAMAARRPVIGYEWGAIPELIQHGETGYLIPFRKPELALTAVHELCANPKLVTRMGEAGRGAAVARYGLDTYRNSFVEAYASILPADRAAAAPVIKAARRPGLKVRESALKLAYFCWHFPVPSETFVLNELELLVAQGIDVIVFCRQTPHKDFKPGFDITYERVESPARLAQRLRETGRTMVHAHFTYPTVTDMVWPACEEAGIPFTFMAHAQDIFRHGNDAKNRLSEIGASPLCRALFTLSRFHLDFVTARGFPRDKVIINPNAVDTTRFAAAQVPDRAKRRTRRIIAVHRFVEKKGLDLLIEAAAAIRDLDVRIDIFGYGEREEAYRQRVQELRLDHVTIHGPLTQAQVVETMREADLFACPSVRTQDGDMDGIPTSLVESMAAGLPVLTTDISGIPDLVTDEITGIVARPTAESVAAAIRRFYALPELKVEIMIETARKHAASRHDVTRAVRILSRVWRNQTIDIVAVAWNNLVELKAVVERVVENTALPYHLILCDNQSTREAVGPYLDNVWRDHDRVTVIHNNRNAMVGPGTNLALAQGVSDYAIYLCAKEGMSFGRGWEIPFVHAFEEQPGTGLVGTVGYSPTYLHGSQYPTGIRLFPQFRNQHFAAENPHRVFGHVQGGLFGIRRAMVDAIGGFSEDVPHDYTDVEYSYYAESLGWKLGEAPGVLALFNKSRPTLSQRFEDSVVVAHPVLLDQIDTFQGVADGNLKHCNVCDWFGPDFAAPPQACPHCGSGPEDRSLQRWLAESNLMHRRLPALGAGLTGKMDQVWSQQFQGPRLSLPEFFDAIRQRGRLPNRGETLALAAFRYGAVSNEDLRLCARELKRLLTRDGVALFQIACEDAELWREQRRRLLAAMRSEGFEAGADVTFASAALAFSYVPMIVLRRITAKN